jgi:hypothetical protein
MLGTEKREHLRILFYQGAIVLDYNNDNGKIIMNNITIKDISLGGLGFMAESNFVYEKQKTYDLKLKADLPWDEIELPLKIAVIRVTKNNDSNYSYGAVYRNLSRSQLDTLKQIIDYQANLDALINNDSKKVLS